MKVEVCGDHETMSRAAAACIAHELARQPALLICLATGSTPARAYELLGARARRTPDRFRQVRVLKLDEWAGLSKNDPGSSEAYLQQRVVQPWGVSQSSFVGFASDPKRAKSECHRIQRWLDRHGPIDLCVLGLGANGHLGFNEPGRVLWPSAHRARLTRQTRAHAMVAHAVVKPKYGLTLGMADILQARRILLLVSGAPKRRALKRLLRGEISTQFPASLLRLHPRTTLLCDRAAALHSSIRIT